MHDFLAEVYEALPNILLLLSKALIACIFFWPHALIAFIPHGFQLLVYASMEGSLTVSIPNSLRV